jgi:hypothetical protein
MSSFLWPVSLFAFLVGSVLLHHWVSGWRYLEDKYAAPHGQRPIAQHSFRWVRGKLGFARTGLSVDLSDEGIWLRMSFPASLLARPVVVPWHTIRTKRLHSFLFVLRAEVRVVGYPWAIRFFGGPSSLLIEESERRGLMTESNNALQSTCEDTRTERRR